MSTARNRRPSPITPLERLDARLAPSGGLAHIHIQVPQGVMHGFAPPKVQVYKPAGTSMDKAGQLLNIVYSDYLAYQLDGGTGTFTSSQSGRILLSGTSVGVDIRATGDIAALSAELKAEGMTIAATSAQFGIIEGTLPISRLPAVAANTSVIGISPILRPSFNRFS